MWINFFVGVFFSTVIIFVPGILQVKALGFKLSSAVVIAPIISIFEYVVLGILFSLVRIEISGWVLVSLVFLLSISLLVTSFYRQPVQDTLGLVSTRNVFIYFGIGILLTGIFYVRCLNGPDSFAQIYDNAFHLSLIETFMETGTFSVLFTSLSPDQSAGIVYYPAMWHVLAALCGSCCSISAPIAENVVNTVFLGLVFPSSFCFFLSVVFRNQPRVIPFGSVVVLGFCAFPWSFLTYGPLYSNIAGFCILPAVLAALMCIFVNKQIGNRIFFVLLFIAGGLVLACAQPNAIFTGIVLLTPFCCCAVYKVSFDKSNKKSMSILVALLFVGFVLALWVFAWLSPFMSGVVNYQWDSFTTLYGAITNILSLSLRESPNQYFLGVLVLIGFVALLVFGKKSRWLLISYLVTAVIYVVSACGEGTTKTLLCGFWYNDPYRTAGCVALAAIPLATYGLYSLCKIANLMIKKLFHTEANSVIYKIIPVCISVFVFVNIYSLDFSDGDQNKIAFEKIEARLEWLSDPSVRRLTEEEENFIAECEKIIEEDAVVINFPFDGSVFSYGSNGLNVLWKSFTSTSENPASSDYIIQNYLGEIATNEDVRTAVQNCDARYVLLLDVDYPASGTVNEDIYSKVQGKWDGVLGVTEAADGFELLLSEGDMRLYKIEAEAN